MAEKRYQANDNYILREIAGESILVPVGEGAEQLNGMLTLNETFRFLWEIFQEPRTIQEAIAAATEQFDGEENRIEKDIRDYVEASLHYGFLKEEDK